jgi:hypothetical protein
VEYEPTGDYDLIAALCAEPTSTADELARLLAVPLPDAATDDDPGE